MTRSSADGTADSVVTVPSLPRSLPAAFAAGAGVGVLGGLVGLGGAEFRLPLLIGVFGFLALQAVIMNKAMSLIVVLSALPARLAAAGVLAAVVIVAVWLWLLPHGGSNPSSGPEAPTMSPGPDRLHQDLQDLESAVQS